MRDRMRLTQAKIDEVITEVVGNEALSIITFLKAKKDISEFKIASTTKYDIQTVRNILYRLYNNNLVSYKRKKDRQKGWYISYWTFNPKKVKELIGKMKREKLDHYKERLGEEVANQNGFFICPQACIRIDFHGADEYEYKCPECGSLLNQQDNIRTIEFLKEKIQEIESTA